MAYDLSRSDNQQRHFHQRGTRMQAISVCMRSIGEHGLMMTIQRAGVNQQQLNRPVSRPANHGRPSISSYRMALTRSNSKPGREDLPILQNSSQHRFFVPTPPLPGCASVQSSGGVVESTPAAGEWFTGHRLDDPAQRSRANLTDRRNSSSFARESAVTRAPIFPLDSVWI